MRIVFMGTPRFAELVLEELLQSDHEVVAVVTRPDAIRGRGKKLVSSPVKACAQRFDIPVLEYSSLKSEEAYQALINFHAEVFCVAAYGALLPKRILELPRFGCLNVHGSLYLSWRGLLLSSGQFWLVIMKLALVLCGWKRVLIRGMLPVPR